MELDGETQAALLINNLVPELSPGVVTTVPVDLPVKSRIQYATPVAACNASVSPIQPRGWLFEEGAVVMVEVQLRRITRWLCSL